MDGGGRFVKGKMSGWSRKEIHMVLAGLGTEESTFHLQAAWPIHYYIHLPNGHNTCSIYHDLGHILTISSAKYCTGRHCILLPFPSTDTQLLERKIGKLSHRSKAFACGLLRRQAKTLMTDPLFWGILIPVLWIKCPHTSENPVSSTSVCRKVPSLWDAAELRGEQALGNCSSVPNQRYYYKSHWAACLRWDMPTMAHMWQRKRHCKQKEPFPSWRYCLAQDPVPFT